MTRLFPEGIPNASTFFDRLEAVRLQFDFATGSEEALGLIWSEAMRRLSAEGRQSLLTAFVQQRAHAVFEPLASLWLVLQDHTFPASFLTEWFVDLVRVVERDSLQDGAWTAIRTQCSCHVETALDVLRLLPTSPDGTRLNIAGFMLGVLRISACEGPHAHGFQEAETFFRDHADARLRAVHDRSWATTARDRLLTPEELDALLARAGRSPEDRDSIIGVICQLLVARVVTGGTAQRCREWIGTQISPAISPEAKHAVVRAAKRIMFSAAEDEITADLSCWILSIQPVPTENGGTWQTIGGYLCDLLKKDPAQFTAIFESLTTTGATTIHRLMQDRHLSRLHRDMLAAGLGDLVGRLCVSPDMDTRRLGLYLFDSLEIPHFPAAVLATSDIASRLLFYELQRVVLSPKSIARILVAVALSVEGATDGFREAVFDELKLQSHNFAGECRTELDALGKTIPLVTKALEEVAAYFTNLERARKAGINAMEVAGFRRAAINQHRRFSREVAKNAATHSTILQLVKKTQLLYGSSSSMFLGGQVLSDPMPLSSSSFSIEVPLIDFCDPEEMAMRRLHASGAINRLLEPCVEGGCTEESRHD